MVKGIDIAGLTHYTEHGRKTITLPPDERIYRACQEEDTDTMTYVITQPCVGVKDASCVDVCPVDCIHPAQNEPEFETAEMLYINPDECIDCGACEPACPVTAIFEESATPEEWKHYIKINADFFK